MALPTPVASLTKNHRLVYDILTEHGTGTHLSMAQLFELAKVHRPGIGFTTVYRGVTRLRDLGLVSEIVIAGAGSAVYEPASHPHAHFRCTRCGRIDDVEYALPPSATSQISAGNGLRIDSIELSLHGRCRDCQTVTPS